MAKITRIEEGKENKQFGSKRKGKIPDSDEPPLLAAHHPGNYHFGWCHDFSGHARWRFGVKHHKVNNIKVLTFLEINIYFCFNLSFLLPSSYLHFSSSPLHPPPYIFHITTTSPPCCLQPHALTTHFHPPLYLIHSHTHKYLSYSIYSHIT